MNLRHQFMEGSGTQHRITPTASCTHEVSTIRQVLAEPHTKLNRWQPNSATIRWLGRYIVAHVEPRMITTSPSHRSMFWLLCGSRWGIRNCFVPNWTCSFLWHHHWQIDRHRTIQITSWKITVQLSTSSSLINPTNSGQNMSSALL